MQKKRNTVQRQIILEAVAALNIHASAEHVYEYVVQKHPNISKATVFRNLSQLAESGELLNIGNFHGSTRYDHNCHDHYHFMCEDCKRIFDVDGDFSDIISRAKGTDEIDITEYQLTFSGLCQECKAKRGNTKI